jgi:hypothetical protein
MKTVIAEWIGQRRDTIGRVTLRRRALGIYERIVAYADAWMTKSVPYAKGSVEFEMKLEYQ